MSRVRFVGAAVTGLAFLAVGDAFAQCPQAEKLLAQGVWSESSNSTESSFKSVIWEMINDDEATYRRKVSGGSGGGRFKYGNIFVGGSGSSSRETIESWRRQHKANNFGSVDEVLSTRAFARFADKNLLDTYSKALDQCNDDRRRELEAELLKAKTEIEKAKILAELEKLKGFVVEVTPSTSGNIVQFTMTWHAAPSNTAIPTITDVSVSNVTDETSKQFASLVGKQVSTAGQMITAVRQATQQPIVYRIVTDIGGQRSGYVESGTPSDSETGRWIKFLTDYGASQNISAATRGVFKNKVLVTWKHSDKAHHYKVVRSDKSNPLIGVPGREDFEVVHRSKSGDDHIFFDNNVKPDQEYTYQVYVYFDEHDNLFHGGYIIGRCRDSSD